MNRRQRYRREIGEAGAAFMFFAVSALMGWIAGLALAMKATQ